MNESADEGIAQLSIILPAKNEARSLQQLLPKILERFPAAEVIVVNDGSTDDTVEVCASLSVRLISHPYTMGNGAAIKTGARTATGEVLVFMDADGQHQPADISRLLRQIAHGYDMAVGARSKASQASIWRGAANGLYNKMASWMSRQRVDDLTSGFRAVRARLFREFLHLLPNGFSYPTTITMAFFRAGYTVTYVPIEALKRTGKSHIRPLRDGIRFMIIIFKIGTLYSPLKIFLPISLAHFTLGLGYYAYTFFTVHRFTNMSALLLSTGVVIFLIGLVSEQITVLIYKTGDST
ncbi:MAG: glycosyltransferase family 2 protein [Pseudolabrys sp.]